MSKVVSLDQKKKSVKIDGLVLEEPLVFEYLNKQPEKTRDKLVVKALYLGVMALMEERISAFISKTGNTLSVELQHLKYIFDLQEQVFFRTTVKGREAELDIKDQLEAHARHSGFKDVVLHCGETSGELGGNKTGDILVKVDGRDDQILVIESKFDKARRLGDFRSQNIFSKGDTAISQLLERIFPQLFLI
jgi:hypothetical protein